MNNKNSRESDGKEKKEKRNKEKRVVAMNETKGQVEPDLIFLPSEVSMRVLLFSVPPLL